MQCYIDFIIASPTVTSHFRRILVARFIVQRHFVTMCACSEPRAPHTIAPHHVPAPISMAMSRARTRLTIALALVFLSVGTDIIHGLAVHFIILCCTVIAKGCKSLLTVTCTGPGWLSFMTTPLNHSVVAHFPCSEISAIDN